MTRSMRGFTLLELMVGLSLLSAILTGVLLMEVSAARTFNRNMAQIDISTASATSLRKVSKLLRNARDAVITNDGATIQYTLPALTDAPDSTTGEREFVVPLQSDGIAHTLYVSIGTMYMRDGSGAATSVIENLSSIDPDPKSSEYGKNYAVFATSSIGSRRAVTITLILRKKGPEGYRYTRIRGTVVLGNFE